MNICYLISNIDPSIGGTERVTMSVANEFKKSGYNVFYIFSGTDNNIVPLNTKLRINYYEREKVLIEKIEYFLKTNRITLLIVVNRVFQTKKFQNIFRYIKLHSDIKIIASLHASPDNWINKNKWGLVLPRVYFKDKIKSIILKIWNPHIRNVLGTYKIVDKYLLLSKSYFNAFIKIYKINDGGKKLIAIPNPSPFNDTYDFNKKENIVLVVSRMQEDQKRIFAVIKIWKEIYKNAHNWKLIIVGDGPDLNIYKRKATNIARIEFKGHSNNVQSYYKRSKVFMMTSIWEGLPMTLIEAMHYGCVPIAFDSFSSLHDIIENGITGFIIPNNDINEYKERLLALMSDYNLYNKMTNQIQYSHNMFKIDKIMEIWHSEIQKL